ncbi:MAG TPA: SLC13 family permease [Pyrinomonadaceae bacterium]|nr:SLC13 family permease [Pyrinomonadaceae bacterium]
MGPIDTNLVITCLVLGAAILLFLSGRLPADLVALLVVVALALTSVLTTQEAFSGFSRSAVITIIAIFVLTEGLQRTGVTDQVGKVLLRVGGRSELQLIVVVMIAGAFLSLFMNNIAAAAVLLPAASGAAKRVGVNTSRLLMPLAFSTILGGMATLFTTSNIVLNSVLRDNDIPGFAVTDFLPVGIPVVIAGILYIALVGRHSLPGDSPLERTQAPDRSASDLVATYHLDQKLFRAKVPDNSFLIGKRLDESTLREDFDVSIVAIERKGRKILDLSAQTELKEGDILILEGDEADFKRRDVEPYMEFLPTDGWRERDLESRSIEVVEAMLSPRSQLIGKTIRDAHFREKYGMSVLAIWHAGVELFSDLADVRLQFGDALLLQGPRQKLKVIADDPDIILLADEDEGEVSVADRGLAAMTVFLLTLAVAIVFPAHIGEVMLGGALVMVLTRIITTEQAYAAVGWKSVFLVAGMLPMGIALTKTNAAGLAAAGIYNSVGQFGPFPLLLAIFLATILLTQMVNGAVAAAIVGPVVVEISQQAGMNPRSVMMAVAMATSMAFITPLGHAVNVLVMSPGGYSFKDYVKVGLPLTVILSVVVMVVLPIVWGL